MPIQVANLHCRAYTVAMSAPFRAVCHALLASASMVCGATAFPALGAAQAGPAASSHGATSPLVLPPLPPAVIDNTLLIGGADIAARKVNSRMTVGVEIEGHGPYRFVVDSGADTSALGLAAARTLRLPATKRVILHSMTASGPVDRVTASALKVGQSTIGNLELPVLKDEDLGAEGLLGIDALVEQRLMMDFEKRLITIEDARRPAKYVAGEIVVIARRRRGQLILTEASANDKSVDAVIDTGSEITIGNLALRDRLFKGRSKGLVTGEATGVTGVSLTMQLARLAELRIGPIVIRDVYIAFADVPPFAAFDLKDRPAMFLGTDLMANFRRVSLDFRARKVRFQLKKCKTYGARLGTVMALTTLSVSDPSANACN